MDKLAAWTVLLTKRMEEELAEMDEDQAFFEQIFCTAQQPIQAPNPKKRGGCAPGKRPNKNRNRARGHQQIWDDYFAENCTYNAIDFRRRFRMTPRLFHRIFNAVCAHEPYFQQRRDAANLQGLSGLQKITAALRQLAQGYGADSTDEYCRLAESTTRLSLYNFVHAIRELFQQEYLRKPTPSDIVTQTSINEKRGFPGMFASLDCMHYKWKNFPVAWQGQFSDKDKKRSIILEAIADQELWIWHAFFGLPGGNNDLNVLDRSPLVNDFLHEQYDCPTYNINGKEYEQNYLLVDGIYLAWSCFVTTIHLPQTPKKSFFAKCQEGCRKDVERAFGVLQARWGIVRQPARTWHLERVTDIFMACVILHNMIIEDERGEEHEDFRLTQPRVVLNRGNLPWAEYLAASTELESQSSHYQLRNDLIEHFWKRKGEVRLADWVRNMMSAE